MSEVLANYIDSLFNATKDVSRPAADAVSDTVTITPVYVMGLTLAIISSHIAEVCPLKHSKNLRISRGYRNETTEEISVIPTARWIVPAAHPLYSSAFHYDRYSLGVRLHDLPILLACDAVGCDVTLPRSSGNWCSQADALDGNPEWLLATFPQYGYALISPFHLLETVQRPLFDSQVGA